MTVNLQHRCDKRVSVTFWTHDIFHLRGFRAKSVGLFLIRSNAGERRELQGTTVSVDPCVPAVLCALLIYTDAMENQVSEVCEVADAPASFESDVREPFVFPLVKK